VAEDESWAVVDSAELSSTVPWRTFRWYKSQLARLIFADFDRAVHRILAQPFLLKAKVDGKVRKHIPDYFLVTDHGRSR
jgi:hypothetical protein